MTETPTPDEIARWAALAEAATAGPWHVEQHRDDYSEFDCPVVCGPNPRGVPRHGIASGLREDGTEQPDAEFIAAARDAVPRLLALVAAQAEQNAELRDQQAWFRERIDEHVLRGQLATLAHANTAADLRTELAAARAELSALRATDEYQRWARAVTERDAAREQVASMRRAVDAVLGQALYRRSLIMTRRAIENVRDEIRAALDQPTPREETTG